MNQDYLELLQIMAQSRDPILSREASIKLTAIQYSQSMEQQKQIPPKEDRRLEK